MSEKVSDVPLALLLGLDGHETVLPLYGLPPPRHLLLPRRERMSCSVDADPSMPRRRDREFVLAPHLRSTDHRWWEVYNNGRSQTPHNGFVYLERRDIAIA